MFSCKNTPIVHGTLTSPAFMSGLYLLLYWMGMKQHHQGNACTPYDSSIISISHPSSLGLQLSSDFPF